MTTAQPVDWRLVVPVKGGAAAKSRLHPPPGISRVDLARAIAHDCLTAVCAGMPRGRVHVVTAAADVAGLAARLGAVVVDDPGAGLNAAVRAGLRAAAAARRDGGHARPGSDGALDRTDRPDRAARPGVAVLLGDLPALRPEDLTTALASAAVLDRAVVPDAVGTGTVLLTAVGGHLPEPAFGSGSADRHTAAGHVRLELDLPRLRTDVDDDASLGVALTLGVGPATRACLEPVRAMLPGMQASVHTFDDVSGAGTALLDDGREVVFSAEVFAASSLRHLRPGQRLSIELAGDGSTVQRLWIVGIGDDQRIG